MVSGHDAPEQRDGGNELAGRESWPAASADTEHNAQARGNDLARAREATKKAQDRSKRI